MKKDDVKWVLVGDILCLNRNPEKTMVVQSRKSMLTLGDDTPTDVTFVGITPEGETVEWNYKNCKMKGMDVY